MVELLIGMSLTFIVMAGILAAYLFMGRNLTRMVNLQDQEVKNRRVLQLFTSDVSSAIQFTLATDTQVVISAQTATSAASYVTYTYTAGAANTGKLTRTTPTDAAGAVISGSIATDLLTGLSAFDFNFFTETNVSTTSLASIKFAQFSYTAVIGTKASGTGSTYTTVSSKVLLRNKPALQ